jgi:predicted RNA-binding Zn-ribbon protein involved in translation (DUF1610 family)
MKYTREYIEDLVKTSKSIWEVVEKTTTMKKTEGNFNYISRLIKRYNIDKSHFPDGRIGQNRIEKPLSEYLVKGKYLTLNGNRLKGKLYKAGLKENKCEECGQGEIWRGAKISLILDHIDGDRDNNELNNLRIICPNCNAALDTHCGKNRKK